MSEKVLALMVTHNREHLLAECLDSLVAQDRPPDHVLVVDNASTDGTSALLEERQGDYFSEILPPPSAPWGPPMSRPRGWASQPPDHSSP